VVGKGVAVCDGAAVGSVGRDGVRVRGDTLTAFSRAGVAVAGPSAVTGSGAADANGVGFASVPGFAASSSPSPHHMDARAKRSITTGAAGHPPIFLQFKIPLYAVITSDIPIVVIP